jgi:hypothetical protein
LERTQPFGVVIFTAPLSRPHPAEHVNAAQILLETLKSPSTLKDSCQEKSYHQKRSPSSPEREGAED